MRRLIVGMILACVLGCAGAGSGDEDEQDSVAAAEGTPAFEGDDAGECVDGADNDRDGSFDCDDADCADSPDCADTGTDSGTAPDVTYPGTLYFEQNYFGTLFSCYGTFTAVLIGGGTVSGITTCEGDPNPGAIEGTVSGTAFAGTWGVPDALSPFAVEGTITTTSFEATGDFVDGSWTQHIEFQGSAD